MPEPERAILNRKARRIAVRRIRYRLLPLPGEPKTRVRAAPGLAPGMRDRTAGPYAPSVFARTCATSAMSFLHNTISSRPGCCRLGMQTETRTELPHGTLRIFAEPSHEDAPFYPSGPLAHAVTFVLACCRPRGRRRISGPIRRRGAPPANVPVSACSQRSDTSSTVSMDGRQPQRAVFRVRRPEVPPARQST